MAHPPRPTPQSKPSMLRTLLMNWLSFVCRRLGSAAFLPTSGWYGFWRWYSQMIGSVDGQNVGLRIQLSSILLSSIISLWWGMSASLVLSWGLPFLFSTSAASASSSVPASSSLAPPAPAVAARAAAAAEAAVFFFFLEERGPPR